MTNLYSSFTGSIPENYDRYLGPFLFDYFAEDIAKRLKILNPKEILEIACGTGIVTKKISEALPDAKITASDLNIDMIEFAKTKINGNSSIQWKTADAMDLPFSNESFDAIICQFGVMFLPDKEQFFWEAKRVLKPGGTFIFNSWDSLEANHLFLNADKVVSEIFKDDPPDFYKVPFSFYDKDEIREILSKVGFNEINIEYKENKCVSESAESLVIGIVKGNPIYSQINERDPSMMPHVINKMEKVIGLKYGEKPVRANIKALICICKK
jgi:ubiquinone/menaquinone biosynthesis C-methylase UbiE